MGCAFVVHLLSPLLWHQGSGDRMWLISVSFTLNGRSFLHCWYHRAGRDGARNQHKGANSLSATVGVGPQPRDQSCPAQGRVSTEINWHKNIGRGGKDPLEGMNSSTPAQAGQGTLEERAKAAAPCIVKAMVCAGLWFHPQQGHAAG